MIIVLRRAKYLVGVAVDRFAVSACERTGSASPSCRRPCYQAENSLGCRYCSPVTDWPDAFNLISPSIRLST